MKVALEEIREGLRRKRFTCKPSSLDLPEDIPPLGQTIGVDVQFSRRRGGIVVEGEVSFTVELICSRCAGPFQSSLRESIDLFYKRGEPRIEVKEAHLTEEEAKTVFHDGEIIDLTIPVRDTVLLAVPTKPLCKEDCKGLCQLCGKDLNEGPCSCRGEEIDPRWRGLAELKKT